MKNDLIKPFVEATIHVIHTMTSILPVADDPYEKNGNTTWGAVSGIIGMSGENISGNMVLSFDKPCVLALVSKILMEDCTEISAEVADAVGEMTNMITGGAKKYLGEQGYIIEMASPMVIKGQGLEISLLSGTNSTIIPFTTPVGNFVVETTLTPKTLKS